MPGITTSDSIMSKGCDLTSSSARAALSQTVASCPARRKARASEASVLASSSTISRCAKTWYSPIPTRCGTWCRGPARSPPRCAPYGRSPPIARWPGPARCRASWWCSTGVNRRSHSSGVRPWPVSATSSRTPLAGGLVRTVRVPPSGMASMAFRTRLRSARRHLFGVGLAPGATARVELGLGRYPRLRKLRLEQLQRLARPGG